MLEGNKNFGSSDHVKSQFPYKFEKTPTPQNIFIKLNMY